MAFPAIHGFGDEPVKTNPAAGAVVAFNSDLNEEKAQKNDLPKKYSNTLFPGGMCPTEYS